MKKRIVLFALSVALIVGMLSAGNAYAWLSSFHGGSQHVNSVKSGLLDYSLGDDAFIVTDEGEYVYPEQNLLTGTVSLANASDISTKLRVKIVYTIDNGAETVWNPTNSKLSVTLANHWTYNSNTGYIDYTGGANNDGVIAASTSSIPLFSKICISGDNTTNSEVEQKAVTVKVIYEARQSDYLTSWNYAEELSSWNSNA